MKKCLNHDSPDLCDSYDFDKQANQENQKKYGLPNGWEIKKLGEVCEVVTKGTTPTSLGFKFTDEGVNFIKVESLTESGQIIPNKVAYISEECHESLKRSQLKENDILFSIAGALGRIGIVNKAIVPANTNQALAIVRLAKNSGISVSFLAKYFTSNIISEEIEKLKGGAAQQNLSLGQLNNLPIPIPPLKEQQRIVSILDECFSAITVAKANAQKNLKNAKELFESYLQGIFENKGEDWEVRRLGESNLIEIIDGDRGKNYPTQKDFLDKGYCLFMNTKNVRPNGFEFNTTMFINEEKDNSMGKGKLKRNDVVMTTRGTIGNLGVYDDDVEYDNIRINSGMLIFRPNLKQITSEYFFEILRSGIIKEQIKKHVTGAAQPQLPIKTLVNFIFPVPKSIKEQQTIVHKLDALSAETKRLEAIYQQKINDLEELKKSILQKAFSGCLLARV
jgi:type I restriction enzyme, S subunit